MGWEGFIKGRIHPRLLRSEKGGHGSSLGSGKRRIRWNL